MTIREQQQQALQNEVVAYAHTLESIVRGDSGLFDEETIEYYGSEMNAYFEDVLDVEFISGLHGEYRSCRITVAFGGPFVTFETRDGWIEGHHSGYYAEYHVQSFATDAIDEYFKSLYELAR